MLELLYSSDARWQSLRAEGHEWRNKDLLAEAWNRQIERRQGASRPGSFTVLKGVSQADGPSSGEATETWKLWIAPPFTRAQFPVGSETIDVVFEESRWWSRKGTSVQSNDGDESHGHGKGWGESLIHPRRYIPCLEVKDAWDDTVAGRQAVTVRAEPVRAEYPVSVHTLHGLVIGDPDEIILAIDAERGVILRSDARLDGQSYRVLEMTHVMFDVTFEPDAFDRPPPGR